MIKRKMGTDICLLDTWIVLCIPILIYSTLTPSMESSAEAVRVAVCQMQVKDGMISENMVRTETFVRDARIEGAEIRVFPELMDVGFGDVVKGKSEARLAFPIPGDTSGKLGAIARKYDVWIVGRYPWELRINRLHCHTCHDNHPKSQYPWDFGL